MPDIGQPYHKNNSSTCIVNNFLSKFLVNYYVNNISERACIFFGQLTHPLEIPQPTSEQEYSY